MIQFNKVAYQFFFIFSIDGAAAHALSKKERLRLHRNVFSLVLTCYICTQAVDGNSGPVYYLKGALEGVLVKCDSYLQHGAVRPLANTSVPAAAVRHAAELGANYRFRS